MRKGPARKPERLPEIFVKPAVAGQIVRDEFRPPPYALDQDGEWKPTTTYWLRRIRMNDVVECKPPKTTAPKAKSSDSKKSEKGKD